MLRKANGSHVYNSPKKLSALFHVPADLFL